MAASIRTTAPAPATSGLSLSTVIKRPTVTIDDTPYEMRSADELAFLVYRGYANKFNQAAALMQKMLRTEAEIKELDALLVDLCEAILLAPKEVHDRLDSGHRFAILVDFSSRLPNVPPAMRADVQRMAQALAMPAAAAAPTTTTRTRASRKRR